MDIGELEKIIEIEPVEQPATAPTAPVPVPDRELEPA